MFYENFQPHRSGLYLPGKYTEKPIAVDLFCGAGGFSLGLIQAGFEVVAALDYSVDAMTTYMYNLGSYPINIHFVEPSDRERMEKFLQQSITRSAREGIQWWSKSEDGNKWVNNEYKGISRIPVSGGGWIKHHPEAASVKNCWVGDIRKVKGRDILDALGLKPGDVDCVCGGPPCQGFSTAGKREVMDPRNSLVFEFARMILEIQPKTFVMENVPGIINMITPDGLPVLDEFCRILEDGGYAPIDAVKKSLLASSGTGAAMKRSSYKKNQEVKKAKKEIKQLSLFGR